MVELEYEERADGLLYPILDIGEDRLNQLGKFGKARLEYLHSQKFSLYRELLFAGTLAKHCEDFEKQADKVHEELFQNYISKHNPSDDDFFERVGVFNQAESYATELVMAQIINV